MSAVIEIHGTCDSRFSAVREELERNFAERGEIGAAVAVTHEGETVVDLWAGHADAARTRDWQEDTIVNVYSTTKGMTSLCIHMLVDRGLVELDAPVARYWPEFAQAGKQRITVRHLLTHTAGLPAIRRPLPPEAPYEWETMTAALEQQEPWWVPGSKHGYHPLMFGWLVGEVLRRVSGKSVGTFFRDEVAEPLGVDFFIGTPASEDHRIADMVAAAPVETPPEAEAATPMQLQAQNNPPGLMNEVNADRWRRAEIPAGNGHGNASGLARVYAALAAGGSLDGVELLGSATIDQARRKQVGGMDAILGFPTHFALGFMLPSPERGDTRPESSFGHPGAGGSLAFADPDARLSFAYVMNQMGGADDVRSRRLAAATYSSV